MGLDLSQIALFLVLSSIGGILSQMPAGILADRVPRRSVLLFFSILATVLCVLMTFSAGDLRIAGIPQVYMLSFLFGFATFPIYSLCAAHASDFVEQDRMLTLSASLIFLYATGTIISPLAAGIIIENFGAVMMFAMIAVAHLLLMLYTVHRTFIRTATRRRSYAYVPRTSLFIASILRNRRGANGGSGKD